MDQSRSVYLPPNSARYTQKTQMVFCSFVGKIWRTILCLDTYCELFKVVTVAIFCTIVFVAVNITTSKTTSD